jgi:hypothetical protein
MPQASTPEIGLEVRGLETTEHMKALLAESLFRIL